jgi:hypothetical protein
MSLKRFISDADVKAKVGQLRPKLRRKIPAPLKVEPRTNQFMLVGTAFDYLLRFELQRRAPHAVSERLIAEYAPERIWRPGFYSHLSMPKETPPDEVEAVAQRESKRAREVVDRAKVCIADYLKMADPNQSAQAELAGWAIRLAKLDEMVRARQLNPTFEETESQDVEDLLGLLGVVPYEALVHPQIMRLNPTFGEASVLVGGADADLISGDMVVDFKATKASEMQSADLDQLLGYYFLARRARQLDSAFPVINRLAIYYCRHGFLWWRPTTTWEEHPEFLAIEEWFFERAKEVFRTSRVIIPTDLRQSPKA